MRETICPSCGATVEWSDQTCQRCGATIKAHRNLVGCRACGAPVAKTANRCPHCGAHTPNPKNFKAGIAAVVIIGVWVIIMIFAAGSSSETPSAVEHPPTSNTSSPAVESKEPEYIEITAEALWSAYEANEVNADLLYGGRLLAVTGTITDIGKDIVTDAPCISLYSGSAYNLYPIQCFFPKYGDQTELIAALQNGDVVTIYGTCKGESLVNVQLSNCQLAPTK